MIHALQLTTRYIETDSFTTRNHLTLMSPSVPILVRRLPFLLGDFTLLELLGQFPRISLKFIKLPRRSPGSVDIPICGVGGNFSYSRRKILIRTKAKVLGRKFITIFSSHSEHFRSAISSMSVHILEETSPQKSKLRFSAIAWSLGSRRTENRFFGVQRSRILRGSSLSISRP